MRLKYKKMILFITMWIMGIGMVTISFKKPPKEDSVPASSDHALAIVTDVVTKAIISDTPTPLPTATPEDPTKLIKNTDLKLNKLIQTFYQAMLDVDGETLQSILTDTSTFDIEKIAKKQEYIEAYDNILCYSKPGLNDGDFVVYVTYDMKITTISTYAPSVDQCYVVKQGDNYLIAFNNFDSKISDLLNTYYNSEDVQALVQEVGINLNKARQSDQDLDEFINNLTNSISQSSSSSEASEGSSEASDSQSSEDSSESSESSNETSDN